MKPHLKIAILTLCGLILYSFFFTGIFKEKVKILDRYEFNEGNWLIMKGNESDSIRYVITDAVMLNKLKECWVLFKSGDNFATTGGYTVRLFKDSQQVMFMDMIYGGSWLEQHFSGILSNSDYGTLFYSNLNWLNAYSDKWNQAKLLDKAFKTAEDRTKFIDSLQLKNKILWMYQYYSYPVFNMEYLMLENKNFHKRHNP
ncbi:MAG TPA: hypothetical protein VE978_22390 [Chitinophagales bacterium]|nr:hypothetical protein [Chitinophagales bacterium]